MSNCSNKQDNSFSIDYEKYQLDNGLNVVLHEDHSDPLVAIATIVSSDEYMIYKSPWTNNPEVKRYF